MERREQLQVIAKSEPEVQEDASSPRSWLVTLQTCISGAPSEIDSTIQNIRLTGSDPRLQVTCLGLVDVSTLVYSVQEDEMEAGESLCEPKLEVSARPLYHDSVSSFYRLDPRLAEFVGRDSLQHPKYSLTMIHSYARANKLYHQKSIKCDDVLFNIFEKESLDLGSLWKEVCKLLRKVETKSISMSLKLSNLTKFSTSQFEISVDNDLNLFPENWKTQINKTSSNLFTRTQSLCPAKVGDKRKSFKRNKSFEL